MNRQYRDTINSYIAPSTRRRLYARAIGGAVASYAAKRAMGYVANQASNYVKGRMAAKPQPVTIVKPKAARKAVSRKPKTLKKQVRALQKQVNYNTSTLTYRSIDCIPHKATSNTAAYLERSVSSVSYIEAVLAQLRFFDPSNPGTLLNASGATGTYSRKYQVKYSVNFVIKNNYQVPCVLKVYKYKAKKDTDQSSSTAFTAGLADIGNPSSTSIIVYPTDSPLLEDLYKLEKCTTWNMKPGQERTYSFSSVFFDYDPSDTDTHALAYQTAYKAFSMLFRVSGVPAHDKTTATQLGTIACGVDIQEKQTYIVRYNSGGPEIKYIYVSDALDTMTAGPVVSQVVVDNQEYSVA